MDNEKCRILIQLYSAKEFLWNSKSTQYHNKSLRYDAWIEISKKMDIPIPDLKKKMTTLLASYRREKSRIAKSCRTGSATNEVYVSKWFAFDDFNFMRDKDLPNETLDTMSENSATAQIAQNNDTGPITPSAMEQEIEPPSDIMNAPDSLRVKKKKKANAEEDSPMLKKAFQVLTESAASSADPYFSYGQHIANELRKYDSRTLIYVKQAINNVIFEADLGKYGCCTQISQSHYTSTPSPQASTPSSQIPDTTTAEREPTPLPMDDFFP
ncbi:unnamed protein product [Pieris macdunnoughi]|uniref:MADF domain-containing protein n=1 Tax=Pieris macdunnoughi TaxID=345717 RepID=A0A821XK91_9NEOP|nr:unnamed protein product [Pieris macdunnoughi]